MWPSGVTPRKLPSRSLKPRQHPPPGFHDQTSRGDIAPSAANSLPRNRFRNDLRNWARDIDAIEIQQAIAAIGNGRACLDPDRRRGQWQGRIGGRADEIAGAAQLVMGKTAGIPAAVVRGLALEGDGSARELVMPPERDLFR